MTAPLPQPPEDRAPMAHGLLIAVLQQLGGHVDLPLDAVQPATMTTRTGAFPDLDVAGIDANTVRLSVASDDEGGLW